jgi:hypothetical protein
VLCVGATAVYGFHRHSDSVLWVDSEVSGGAGSAFAECDSYRCIGIDYVCFWKNILFGVVSDGCFSGYNFSFAYCNNEQKKT